MICKKDNQAKTPRCGPLPPESQRPNISGRTVSLPFKWTISFNYNPYWTAEHSSRKGSRSHLDYYHHFPSCGKKIRRYRADNLQNYSPALCSGSRVAGLRHKRGFRIRELWCQIPALPHPSCHLTSQSLHFWLSGQDNKIKVSKGCSAVIVAPVPAKVEFIMGKVFALGKMRRVREKLNK